jgi:hypothetical protein
MTGVKQITVVALEDITIANGLGWSPDGEISYYIDTPTGRIDRFAFGADEGRLDARSPFVTIDGRKGCPTGSASTPQAACGSPSGTEARSDVTGRRASCRPSSRSANRVADPGHCSHAR